MDFKFIKDLLDTLDPASILPGLDGLLGKLDTVLRLAVLIAPLVLLILGLIYFFLPPKEANHSVGYQLFWGKSSVEAWRFTQWVAGMVFGGLGIILTIVMLILSAGFAGMETTAMVLYAGKCILWELGLVAAACLSIDLTVVICFDRKGVRRSFARRKPRVKSK